MKRQAVKTSQVIMVLSLEHFGSMIDSECTAYSALCQPSELC